MNAEKALQNAILNPDLLILSGSRLYGTNRPESDEDFRGFVIPPYEYLLGMKHFNDQDVEGADHKVYNLQRFFDLIKTGDPQCSEALFCPENKIVRITDIGREVIKNRHLFISNKIYNRIMGYSYSEWRKAMAVKVEIVGRTKTEEDVILDIRNNFKPDKDGMDTILEILYQNREKKLIPSTRKLGEKRKKDLAKFGFCVSSAAHSLRLMGQLVELMTTGTITFPRPNSKELLGIRIGDYNRDEVKVMYDDLHAKAENARKKSVLPDVPEYKKIDQLYERLVLNKLNTDDRFLTAKIIAIATVTNKE